MKEVLRLMWTDLGSAVMALLRVVISWRVVEAALRQLGTAWHRLTVVAARAVSRGVLVAGHMAAAARELRQAGPRLGRAGLRFAAALSRRAGRKITRLMRPEDVDTEAPAFLELLVRASAPDHAPLAPRMPLASPAPLAPQVPLAPPAPVAPSAPVSAPALVAQPVLRAAVETDAAEAPVLTEKARGRGGLGRVAQAAFAAAVARLGALRGWWASAGVRRVRGVVPGVRAASAKARGVVPSVRAVSARARGLVPGVRAVSAKARGVVLGRWAVLAKVRGVVPDMWAAAGEVRGEIRRAAQGLWASARARVGAAGHVGAAGARREVAVSVRCRVVAAARWAGGAGVALGRRVSAAMPGWAGALRLAAGKVWEAAGTGATGLLEKGFRIPGGAKALTAGIAAVAVILSAGFGVAHLSRDEPAPVTMPSPVVSSAAPAPELVQAAAAVPEIAPKMLPLSRFNPITGPDRPPLPEDASGPQGSLRTTGTYEVALTFDDGPDPRWTPEVLRMLREHKVKATFCVIGVNVIEFPELIRDIDADGHTLCNHSWGHDTGLGNRSYATIVADMQRTNDVIRAAAPRARISYFRHPGGNWTAAAVRAARSLGMTSLHWDVDPRDWLRPGPRAISSTVTGSAIPGSIVLMHDGGGDRRGTADALRSILPNLTSRFPLVALPPGVDPPKLYGIHLPVHAGQE